MPSWLASATPIPTPESKRYTDSPPEATREQRKQPLNDRWGRGHRTDRAAIRSRDIVSQFREDELPMSTVDVSRAMQAGRRRRRMTVLTAAAAVIALIVTGSLLLARPSDPPPPAAPTCGSPSPARPSTPTWEHFDPMISEFDTSAVQGYRATITGMATYYQDLGLINNAGDRTVEIILYACGGEPHSIADETVPIDPATGQPADPVHGVPAYWLPTRDPASVTALAWQWTPGAWAIVAPYGVETSPPQAELRTIAAQVAQQIAFGAGTPVTAPFSLPVPAGMYPAVTVAYQSFFWFGFDTVGTAAPTHVAGYVPHLWVNADALATIDKLPAGATEYPEDLGHPAYQSDLRNEGRDSDILLVYDFFGFGLEIEPRGMSGTREEKLRFAADVFRTINIYPGAATGPSAWGNPIAAS